MDGIQIQFEIWWLGQSRLHWEGDIEANWKEVRKLIMGGSILGSGNSQFKDSRAGACLARSRNRKGE